MFTNLLGYIIGVILTIILAAYFLLISVVFVMELIDRMLKSGFTPMGLILFFLAIYYKMKRRTKN